MVFKNRSFGISLCIASFLSILPQVGECQVSSLIKPVLIPIAKKVIGDVVIQGGTDVVATTALQSYVEGKFSPGISDPQFESVPKVFEYMPVTAELIDVAVIGQGVWEIGFTYVALEEERRSREAVDRMIRQMQATAHDRAMKDRIARAAWFRAHLQRLIDANASYNSATTQEERDAALTEIDRIRAFARRLAGQVGINNVDISLLPAVQAQTIAVNFFDYDLVNRKPIGR